MKAINCTQCGATINDVSETSMIIDCDYCGARILLPKESSSTQTRQPLAPPVFDVQENPSPPAKAVLIAVGIAALIPILLVVLAVRNDQEEPATRISSVPTSPAPYSTPASWSSSTGVPDKPLPVVNYQPRISWDGPNDLEHFEEPEVDIASVSHLTTQEVKDTVFKDRVVKLRVVINTDGEIDDVETISGHPILVEAATLSARLSIFRSRSKPTKRILTYTFRVLND